MKTLKMIETSSNSAKEFVKRNPTSVQLIEWVTGHSGRMASRTHGRFIQQQPAQTGSWERSIAQSDTTYTPNATLGGVEMGQLMFDALNSLPDNQPTTIYYSTRE